MQASLLCRIVVKNTRPSVFSTQGPFIITTKLNALLRFSCDVGFAPNITGSFSWDKHMFIGVSTAGEAFSSATTIGTGYTYSAYEAGDKRKVSFAASKSNDAYGKSAVVQPASLSLLACIRF